MIQIPDALLCRRVVKHRAYCDEKSVDPRAGKPKRKYKVSGHHVASTCLFFVLTSKYDAVRKDLTLVIERDQWVDREPNHLHTTSYMDVTKHEVLSYGEVAARITDGQNGFKEVAKLPAQKIREFKNQLIRAKKRTSPSDIPKVISEAIKRQAEEEGGEDAILKELGLA